MQKIIMLAALLTCFWPIGRGQGLLSSFKNVAVVDDLPQNTVQAMVQDEAGFLWIGSESGLLRYDGRGVKKYVAGQNGNFFLTDNSINSIEKDGSQNFWVATTEGISIFNPNQSFDQNLYLTRLAAAINQKVGRLPARCFYFGSNNTVYIGHTYGVSVINMHTKQVDFYPDIVVNGVKSRGDIMKITDRNGKLLLLSATQGLLVGDLKNGFTSIAPPSRSNIISYADMVSFSVNRYLLATSTGLVSVFNTGTNRWQRQTVAPTAGKMITVLEVDSARQQILAGTDDEGFYVLDMALRLKEQIKKTVLQKTLPGNNVVSILTDKNGEGYWVGTSHGLCRFFYKENAFHAVPFYDNKGGPNKVYPIYTENNRDIVVGTFAGLYQLQLNGKEAQPRLVKNTENIQFYSIAKPGKQGYLFGTRNGIYESGNGIQSIKRASAENRELAFADGSKIYCILPLNDNEVLFAYRNDTACGIIRWNRLQHTATICRPDAANPLSSKNKISNIVRAGADKVIVCNNDGVVYYYPDTHSFKDLARPGPRGVNYAQVSDAIADGDKIWITTYGGGINLLNIKTNTFRYITEKNGLANNDLYAIHKTAENRYWVSSNKGIGYFNPDNGQFTNYTKSNGLLDNEYDRRSSFKCGDTLYFGGLSGLVCFNYKILQQASPVPPVFISGILSYEKGNESEIPLPEGNEELSFPQSGMAMRIQLSFPYYIFPENSRFFYRVLPGDTTWLHTGNSNSILLPGLPAGRHTIETRAVSSTGVWSSNVASLGLFIKPYWFQTTWFRLLLALALAAVFVVIYKVRVYQVKKEYSIKRQISRDLHDDLGGTLSSIRLFSQMAAIDTVPGQMEKIKEAASEAITGLKDLVWTLDDDKNTLYDLTERLKQFCDPLFELKSICFTVQSQLNLGQVHLKKKEKKELFMILKEAAVNCLKYSSCKNAILEIKGSVNALTFLFYDDGTGLSASFASNGNGLKNMQNRAAAINYNVDISSPGSNGTCICIKRKR